jgi:hypothetical protein
VSNLCRAKCTVCFELYTNQRLFLIHVAPPRVRIRWNSTDVFAAIGELVIPQPQCVGLSGIDRLARTSRQPRPSR